MLKYVSAAALALSLLPGVSALAAPLSDITTMKGDLAALTQKVDYDDDHPRRRAQVYRGWCYYHPRTCGYGGGERDRDRDRDHDRERRRNSY